MRYKKQNETDLSKLSKATSSNIMKWRDGIRKLKGQVLDTLDPYFDARDVPLNKSGLSQDDYADIIDWWKEIHDLSYAMQEAIFKETRVEIQDLPEPFVEFYDEWTMWDDVYHQRINEVYNKLELIEPAMSSLEEFLDRGMDALLSIRTLRYMGIL